MSGLRHSLLRLVEMAQNTKAMNSSQAFYGADTVPNVLK